MADLDFRLQLAAEGGQATAKQVDAITEAIERTRKDIDSFAKSGGIGAIAVGADKIDAARKQAEVLGSELLESARYANELRERLNQIDPKVDPQGYSQLQRQIISTEASAANMRKELAMLPRDLRESTADSVGYLGDIDSSLQAIGGTLRSIGDVTGIGAFGQAAGVAQFAGDLFAAAEAIPRLASAASQLQANLTKVAAVTNATTASEYALAAARALSNPLVLAGVAAIAAGGIALISSIKHRNEEREAMLEAFEAQRKRIASLNEERQNLLEASSASDLVTRFEELKTAQGAASISNAVYADAIRRLGQDALANSAQLLIVADAFKATKDNIDETTAALELFAPIFQEALFTDELQRKADDQIRLAKEALTITNEEIRVEKEQLAQDKVILLNARAQQDARVKALESELASLERGTRQYLDTANSLETARDGLESFDAQLAEVDKRVGELNGQLQVAANINDASAESIKRVEEARQAEIAAMEDQQAAFDQLLQDRKATIDELEGVNDQIADLERSRIAATQKRAEEETLRASQASREAALVSKIEAAKQQEAIAKIQDGGRDKILAIVSKQRQEEAKAVQDYNKAVDKINGDFMQSELRAIQDYNRERKRLEQDLEDDLLDAALANDVNRFIALRNEAVKQIGRGDEDFNTERDRATQDRNQRLAELRIQFEEQRRERAAAAQAELQQIRQEQQAQLQEMANAGKNRLTLVQKLEQDLLKLRATFADETKALQLKFERDAHNQRVNQLQVQAAELSKAVAAYEQQLLSIPRTFLQAMQLGAAGIQAMQSAVMPSPSGGKTINNATLQMSMPMTVNEATNIPQLQSIINKTVNTSIRQGFNYAFSRSTR